MSQGLVAQDHSSIRKPLQLSGLINKLAYVAGIASPIATLPQLFEIWINKDASGVSTISWFSYCVIALIMGAYGIIHKEKQLIIMYSGLALVNLLVAIGSILY